MPVTKTKFTKVDIIVHAVNTTKGIAQLEVPRNLLKNKYDLRQYIQDWLTETTMEGVDWMEDEITAVHVEHIEEVEPT